MVETPYTVLPYDSTLNNMKTYLLSLVGMGCVLSLQAQVTSDALLYSDIQPTITARSVAVGNALGALGGDLNSLTTNPAGLAIYRNSEISVTPGLSIVGTRTQFADSTTRDSRAAAQLGSLGAVFAGPLSDDNWRGLAFGISFNRLVSFSQDFRLDGTTYGSRLATWADQAQGYYPNELNPFENRLAYDAYLIDNPGGGTSYVSALTDDNYVRKKHSVRQTGGISELSLGFGGNFKNILYVGASIGIDFLNLRDERIYEEIEETDSISFKEMMFTETRRVKGTGFNARFGVIYRPIHFMRIGLSFTTPTAFSCNERYYTSVYGKVIYNDTLRNKPYDSPSALYPHRVTTPLLATASLGFIFGKKSKPKWGFLGIDAEFVHYEGMGFGIKYNDPNSNNQANIDYINGLNTNLDAQFRNSFRLRVGTELVFKALRVRLGYRFQGSPYREAVAGVSDFRHHISGGIGIRQENFFVDLSYVHSLRQFEHLPYYSSTVLQQAIVTASGGMLLITAGFRFGGDL